MCVDCVYGGCLGCSRGYCECDSLCFKCWEGQNVRSGCMIQTVPNSFTPYRKRFLCTKCKRCWKEKYDKYTKELSSYTRVKSNILSEADFKELTAIGVQNDKFRYSSEPICSCGSIGIVIGEKFRPVKKTDTKEWKKIFALGDRDKEILFSNYCPKYSSKIRLPREKELKRTNAKNPSENPILQTSDILKYRYNLTWQ